MTDSSKTTEKGGVRVVRGVRGLSPNPDDEVLVRTEEPVYLTSDGTHRTGVVDQDDAFQVLPAGSTVTAAQAREYGLSDSPDPAKLEDRREQFPDYLGGSAAVDQGTIVPVAVAGSTRGPLGDDLTVQTAEEVDKRVQDAISAHREGRPTEEQQQAAEPPPDEPAERQTPPRRQTAQQAAQRAETDK